MLQAVILLFLPLAAGLIGYDCGGEGFNITTLSLLDIGICDMEDLKPVKEEAYIQLMQLSDYDRTSIVQCKLEVDRTVYYCGMHSHVSVVHNGRREYIHEIAEQACRKLYETGTITIANAVLDRIMNNHTNMRSVTLAESAGKRIWKGFITFGSASAGVLAIFVIVRVTKLVIDTIIHGYALHSVYGWSIHLLGAIWSSITNLLLHTGGRRQQPLQGQEVNTITDPE